MKEKHSGTPSPPPRMPSPSIGFPSAAFPHSLFFFLPTHAWSTCAWPLAWRLLSPTLPPFLSLSPLSLATARLTSFLSLGFGPVGLRVSSFRKVLGCAPATFLCLEESGRGRKEKARLLEARHAERPGGPDGGGRERERHTHTHTGHAEPMRRMDECV